MVHFYFTIPPPTRVQTNTHKMNYYDSESHHAQGHYPHHPQTHPPQTHHAQGHYPHHAQGHYLHHAQTHHSQPHHAQGHYPQPHHSQPHHAQPHHAQPHQAQPVTHNLLTDGYISYTFTPKIAEFYLVQLLFKVANSLINTIPDSNGSGAYFVFNQPSFYTPPPLTISGQGAWVLDYDVRRSGGSVVPQELWFPQGEGDRRRYVEQAQFRIPVFFVGEDGSLGVPVLDAAAGHMQLRDTYLPPPLQDKKTVKLRTTWPVYGPSRTEQQVQLRDQTDQRNPITFKRFVKYVASRVEHFLAECERVPVQPFNWMVGHGNITADEVMLIGIVQVSEGSWTPILQLMRRVVI